MMDIVIAFVAGALIGGGIGFFFAVLAAAAGREE